MALSIAISICVNGHGSGGGGSGGPTLTSLNVPSGSTLGGTVVVGTGTNLTGVTGVTVGGVAATSVSSTATTVTFTTPAGSAGPQDVVVTTPAGTATLLAGFTYVAIVAFDNAATFVGTSGVISTAYTNAGNILYALTNRRVADGFTNTGCTYNGVAMTQIGVTENPTGTSQFKLWRLVAPASGAHTFATTVSGGTASLAAAVWSGTNANQVTPESAVVFALGPGGTTVTATNAVALPQLAISFACVEDTGGSGTFSATGTATHTLHSQVAQGNQHVGVGDQTARGSVVSSYSYSRATPDAIAEFVVVVNPVGGTLASISRQVSSKTAGAAVTIKGVGFVGTPAVTIGGQVAGSIVYVDSTTITCTLPSYSGSPSAQGSAVDLVVGGVTMANAVTYFPDPVNTFAAAPDLDHNSLGTWISDVSAGNTQVFDATVALPGHTQSLKSTLNPPDASALNGVFIQKANSFFQLPAGVWTKCWYRTDTASMANAQAGQVKLQKTLNDAGHVGYYSSNAIGVQAGASVPGDWRDLYLNTAFDITQLVDGVWKEMQWGQWRLAGGVGRTLIIADGHIVYDHTDASLGNDTATDIMDIHVGGHFQQAIGGAVSIWSAGMTVKDGFIE